MLFYFGRANAKRLHRQPVRCKAAKYQYPKANQLHFCGGGGVEGVTISVYNYNCLGGNIGEFIFEFLAKLFPHRKDGIRQNCLFIEVFLGGNLPPPPPNKT